MKNFLICFGLLTFGTFIGQKIGRPQVGHLEFNYYGYISLISCWSILAYYVGCLELMGDEDTLKNILQKVFVGAFSISKIVCCTGLILSIVLFFSGNFSSALFALFIGIMVAQKRIFLRLHAAMNMGCPSYGGDRKIMSKILFPVLLLLLGATPVFASDSIAIAGGTQSLLGYISVAVFVVSYIFVILEDKIHLPKSKPVLMSAGILWFLVAIFYNSMGRQADLHKIVEHNLLEYGELFLFLLVAMTYVNTIEERNVFQFIKGVLVSKGYSLRSLFWRTGIISFFMSAIADNLTTALVMSSVAMSVGQGNPAFIAACLVSIVIAANAGGVFSAFGDITTLMVWQSGHIEFFEFFVLFIPALVSWIIPALYMSYFAFENSTPEKIENKTSIKKGGLVICFLFLLTIAFSVLGHQVLHLPPVIGMMTGLGFLKVYSYFITRYEYHTLPESGPEDMVTTDDSVPVFNIFEQIKRAEWDTLLFFYGVMMSVGALGAFGYLTELSKKMYSVFSYSVANILVGFVSAIVDNIPVMYSILQMNPTMDHLQWLLVTFAAGTGGSMLAIGSAAGVALMGVAKGVYTIEAHLKYTIPIGIGYLVGAYILLLMN